MVSSIFMCLLFPPKIRIRDYFKNCFWHSSFQEKQKQLTLGSTRFKSRAEALLFETQFKATQTKEPLAGVKFN